MKHEIITGLPGYQQIAADQGTLERNRREYATQSARRSDAYRVQMSKWRTARDAAVVAGESPPPRPTSPNIDPMDAAAFGAERARLDRRMDELLARNAEQVAAAAESRERELLATAKQAAAVLQAVGVELRELAAAVKATRAATGDRRRVRSGPIGPVDVIGVAMSGASFLDPPPKVGGTTYFGRVDEEDVAGPDYEAPRGTQTWRPRKSTRGR